MNKCSVCKSNAISELEDAAILSYKGNELAISIKYSICDSCHNEFISTAQILENDATARDARKKYDGLMTSIEIRAARKKLGLTQEVASRLFGGGRHAFSKYERAEVSQSIAMDKLIKVCLKHPDILDELAQ